MVKEAYRGFTVSAAVDGPKLEEIFEVRLLLEPQACALAAKRRSPAELEQLRAIIRTSVSDPGMNIDGQFHGAIADASHNSVLAEEVRRVQQMPIFSYVLYSVADHATTTCREHTDILEAIASGDAPAAEAAMRRHLEQSRERHREQQRQKR